MPDRTESWFHSCRGAGRYRRVCRSVFLQPSFRNCDHGKNVIWQIEIGKAQEGAASGVPDYADLGHCPEIPPPLGILGSASFAYQPAGRSPDKPPDQQKEEESDKPLLS